MHITAVSKIAHISTNSDVHQRKNELLMTRSQSRFTAAKRTVITAVWLCPSHVIHKKVRLRNPNQPKLTHRVTRSSLWGIESSDGKRHKKAANGLEMFPDIVKVTWSSCDYSWN